MTSKYETEFWFMSPLICPVMQNLPQAPACAMFGHTMIFSLTDQHRQAGWHMYQYMTCHTAGPAVLLRTLCDVLICS
ncbi:hypothetical protein IF2G_04272 [Cordyceps javanica]|nr:hypothetical protein IF2G_04272 [Cordyceps javanica]